jgi:hypothetical protein
MAVRSHAPATRYPQEDSWYLFLLEAESISGWKDEVNWKIPWTRGESNPRPSGLLHSASTNYVTAQEHIREVYDYVCLLFEYVLMFCFSHTAVVFMHLRTRQSCSPNCVIWKSRRNLIQCFNGVRGKQIHVQVWKGQTCKKNRFEGGGSIL